MSQLNQLQVSYHSKEDRLLLRINLTNGEEFGFWWTRALIKRLWPALHKCAANDPQVQQQTSEASRQAVQDFQRQAAVASTNFETPYQPPPKKKSPPTAPRPSLVVAARLAPQEGGLLNLRLKTDANLNMDIKLSNQLLHAFMHMLQDAVSKTHWDLKLETASLEKPPPSAVN